MKGMNLSFIAQRRSKLDITLQDMALALGFRNASTYMKYEKGEYIFKANHLPVLSEMLKCNVEELFFEGSFAELANSQPTGTGG